MPRSSSSRSQAERRTQTIRHHAKREQAIQASWAGDGSIEYEPKMRRASIDNDKREDGVKGNGEFRYIPRSSRETRAITQEFQAF